MSGSARSGGRIAGLVTQALLSNDLPDATPAEVAAARAHVDAAVAAMPDVARAGVTVAAWGFSIAASVVGGRPFARQTVRARSRNAAVLARLPLPVLAEFVRLSRGLGLVAVYDGRETAGR